MNSFNILGNILLLVERFSRRSNINKKQKQLSWFSKWSGLCFDSAVGVRKQTDRQASFHPSYTSDCADSER